MRPCLRGEVNISLQIVWYLNLLECPAGLLTDILSMRRDNYQAILSIGDKKGDAERFSKMAASLRKRDQFYVTLTKFLFERGFSGVLLNWEFPTQHGGHFVDRHNFITLLKELKIM